MDIFSMIHPHDGQLTPEERQLLYETVIESKPTISIECGTWKGLGSTFYIALALQQNQNGKLFTYEVNEEFYNIAVEKINGYGLQSFINFHLEDYLEGYKKYNFPTIDFAFLDGPDDPSYALKSLVELENLIPKDKYVILHDWKQEKCQAVKEYILSSNIWAIDKYIDTMAGMIRIRRK
jgi:predicted O-methyltransferase YrrM